MIKKLGGVRVRKHAEQNAAVDVLDSELAKSVVCNIPVNELWLQAPFIREKLEKALAWAEANPSKESNLDDL